MAGPLWMQSLRNIIHKNTTPYTHEMERRACHITTGSKYANIHYNDVIMGGMVSQITNLTIVYSTVYSGPDQRKHQSSASLAFVRGIHRWQTNSPHKGPVTRKMFPFDYIIMFMAEKQPTTVHYTDVACGFSSEEAQYCGGLMFSLMIALAICWTNSRVVRVLSRHNDDVALPPWWQLLNYVSIGSIYPMYDSVIYCKPQWNYETS